MMSGNIRKEKNKEIVKIELESRDKQEIFNMATKTNEKELLKYFFFIIFFNQKENNKQMYTRDNLLYVLVEF
jgi:hypothetical protein